MTNPETQQQGGNIMNDTNPTVIEATRLLFGNAESSISLDKKLESGQFSSAIVEKSAELIKSGELMTPVDDEDDGCIDGRYANAVAVVTEDGTFTETPFTNDNHERAKVAGGGYITGYAMYHGLVPGQSIETDLGRVSELLASEKVYCGAHTGAHRHEGATDCGANDKIQTIFENAVRYRDEIEGVTNALLGLADIKVDSATFDKVIAGWAATLDNDAYFDGSNGETRLNTVAGGIAKAQIEAETTRPLAVSKHLDGDHNEAFIVVNYRSGETLSQGKLHESLQATYKNATEAELPQAFVVDVWRIVKLAEALSNADDRISFEEALTAGVAYQVATAATLTDGTLRIFAVK